DEPVVVGRVFNAADAPPNPLPQGRARTTWRSRATPGGDAGHELTFEDAKGGELVRLRSARDLAKVVAHDERVRVAEHATQQIGGSRAIDVAGAELVEAGRLSEVRLAAIAPRAGAAGPEVAPLATRREIVAKRITLTTGGATIVLDGPDIVVAGEKNVSIVAGGTVSIQGEPYVHLNPPAAAAPTQPAEKGQGADHVAWFRLTSDGRPLAGVRVHLQKPGDDASSARFHETDGKGEVRVPLSEPATFHASVAHGSTHAPEGVRVATVPSQPAAHAKPTEHDVPVQIEIVDPKPHETHRLHTTPDMPELPLEARVLVGGKAVDVGHVGWTFRVEGHYRVRSSDGASYREQRYRLPAGHAMTSPSEKKRFRLAPGELVGGDLSIDVHFSGGEALGGLHASRRVTGLRVLGQNPPREAVERHIAERAGHLAWVLLRLFCFESLHKLAQFAEKGGGGNTPGEPLYGPPSGVGIVQRDPTAGEWHFPKNAVGEPNNFFPRIFWDWTKNLDEGISSFKGDYIERGRRDLDLLRQAHPHLPPYSEGVLLRAAIRRYNGGVEYGASADGRHYVVSPSYTNNPGYVENVLDDPHADAHRFPVPHDARARVWPG
ncbi:MAG TPA: hypothetical protein VHB21_09665, partial [Minicystis sp.]|nr:hypothetical protein [Minicystis sp.]